MTPSQPDQPKRRSGDTTRATYMIFGLVAGGILILAGVGVIIFEVLTGEGTDMPILAVGIGLVLLGGTAAMPAIFMPILSAVLKKVPGRVQSIEPPKLIDDDKPDG